MPATFNLVYYIVNPTTVLLFDSDNNRVANGVMSLSISGLDWARCLADVSLGSRCRRRYCASAGWGGLLDGHFF